MVIESALCGSVFSMIMLTMFAALPVSVDAAVSTANNMKTLGLAGMQCLVSIGLLVALVYQVRRREAEQLEAREDMKKAHDIHTQHLYTMIKESTTAAEQVRDVGIRTVVIMERVDETMKHVNACAEARVNTCHTVLERYAPR